MEPFKNLISTDLTKRLADLIKKYDPNFNSSLFQNRAKKQINELELKDRVRLLSNQIHEISGVSYPEKLKIFNKVIPSLKGFELWPISQYIEDYGHCEKKYISKSLETLSILTTLFTAEFAIRDYINHHEEQTYEFLELWAKSENEHLRRLASEGTRPNLPWGKKLDNQKRLMDKNLKILESLKYDSSEYVRKSVSNHLNDISRIDKKLYLTTIARWQEEGIDKKLIRHSLRTLLKAGDSEALKILGYKKSAAISGKINKVAPKKISEGDKIKIQVDVQNNSSSKQLVLIDFVLCLLQKNSKYSQKVFRIKDTKLIANETLTFEKDFHFKRVTTRKHYPGLQYIKLQINGNTVDEKKFELI